MVFNERADLIAVDGFFLEVIPTSRSAGLLATGARPPGRELARSGLDVDFVLDAVAFVDFSSHRQDPRIEVVLSERPVSYTSQSANINSLQLT